MLLPFIVIYELYAAGLIGTTSLGTKASTHITAFLLIESMFRMLGVIGQHLPAFALVGMLLGAHLWRRDPWRFHPGTPFAIVTESIVWSLPLLVLGWVMARYLPLAGISLAGNRWAILCVGAGIYEEMVFRLILLTLLAVIVRDLIGWRSHCATVVILLAGGLLFAFYHYLSPGEDFRLRSCVFRTLAGGYFGALYLARGFGVTALSHVAYDIIVVGLLSPR